jgi:predicted HicB family RNase H-like nuclease
VSEITKFSLRLPKTLNLKLKELADKDSRSLNNYIIKVLEEHVNKMEQKQNQN